MPRLAAILRLNLSLGLSLIGRAGGGLRVRCVRMRTQPTKPRDPPRPVDLGASCFSGLGCRPSVGRAIRRRESEIDPEYRGKEPIHEHVHAGEFDDARRSARGEPGADLRHDAARRRAIAGREHEHGREARGGPGPGRARASTSSRPGFPIASVGDFEAVRAIAAEVTGSSVCGLARCNDRDIDRAWEAIQYAQKPRIHVFLATSAIHREHKLRMTKAQIIEKAVASVRRAKGYCAGHRVQPRGRRADRARLPLRGRRGGHRGRRHHGQHPRHRRLRHAAPVRAA